MATQTEIPGTEHPHGDKQLDELLAARRKTSKMRKKWQDREVEEGEQIAARMKEKKFEVYVAHNHSPPLIARLKPSEKLKIDEYEDGSSDTDLDDAEVEEATPSEQKAKKKTAAAEA